ncbi:adenosine deaminase AGSA-like isoform X1 [Physella acuta]|uniref:adenosine deaminase AGSA-like isoform X1 n=1 Tax=Physella acuta TaxID=109671 RepID=UPI0027DC441B|nr:adenosine deaminase AGSA-like isoform X1 [Physella acuta]
MKYLFASMTSTIVCILLAVVTVCSAVPAWYLNARQSFIESEASMRVGAGQVLNAKEEKVNRYLMQLKNAAVQESITSTIPYPPAVSFFKSKDWIDNSTIYDIIKLMPKGGVLHLHDGAMTSLNWTVKTLTYLPNLYTKKDNDRFSTRLFNFSVTSPGSDWDLVSDLRQKSGNVEQFDEIVEGERDLSASGFELETLFEFINHELFCRLDHASNTIKRLMDEISIKVTDPFISYPSINDVWQKFNCYFNSMFGLIHNLPNIKLYVEQALKEFYSDGVQYMEFRSGFFVDTNGTDVTESYLKILQTAVTEFKQQHSDFVGVRVIIPGTRSSSPDQMANEVSRALGFMQEFPDLVMGFDLVEQEDTNHDTLYFVDQLLKDDRSIMPYFFHAGETDWNQGVDYNLIDSVLLNASRIGHGFAAMRHPKVMEAVIARGIAIELNPISNQVLGLVNDIRNHPGSTLIGYGAPVVVSSDDPAVWFASPLSHDFYMAFMALGGLEDDLRLLKQLAINSFVYSTLTEEQKEAALQKWQTRWNAFIDDVIAKYSLQ